MSEAEAVGRIFLNHHSMFETHVQTLAIGKYPSDFEDDTDEEIEDKYQIKVIHNYNVNAARAEAKETSKKTPESASRYRIMKRDEEKRYASSKYLRFSDYVDVPTEDSGPKHNVNGLE